MKFDITGRIHYADSNSLILVVDNEMKQTLQKYEKLLAAPLLKHYPDFYSCCQISAARIHFEFPLSWSALTMIPGTEVHIRDAELHVTIRSGDKRNVIASLHALPHLLEPGDEFLEQAQLTEVEVPKLSAN